MNFRAIGNALEDVEANVSDRMNPAKTSNPQQFLKTWIKDHAGDAVIGLASRLTDDGSGFLAEQTLNAGTDPQLKPMLATLF